jgi:hypothetical protein
VKITFLAINYNTYDSLTLFLDSINNAIDSIDSLEKVLVQIFIQDNTPIQDRKMFEWRGKCKNLDFKLFTSEFNSGYLGGVELLLRNNLIREAVLSSNYTVISNVDLTLENDFLQKLQSLIIKDDIGWIAPSIYSYFEKRDRNPKILKRPNKNKLKILEFVFINPIFYFIYLRLIYSLRKKKRKNQSPHYDRKYIYAGHGSFMIFTRKFFKQNINFKFPSFLFCEEIYFGELVRIEKMKVQFVSELKILDSDHVSTGKLKRKSYCRMNRDSLRVIRKEFFR